MLAAVVTAWSVDTPTPATANHRRRCSRGGYVSEKPLSLNPPVLASGVGLWVFGRGSVRGLRGLAGFCLGLFRFCGAGRAGQRFLGSLGHAEPVRTSIFS